MKCRTYPTSNFLLGMSPRTDSVSSAAEPSADEFTQSFQDLVASFRGQLLTMSAVEAQAYRQAFHEVTPQLTSQLPRPKPCSCNATNGINDRIGSVETLLETSLYVSRISICEKTDAGLYITCGGIPNVEWTRLQSIDDGLPTQITVAGKATRSYGGCQQALRDIDKYDPTIGKLKKGEPMFPWSVALYRRLMEFGLDSICYVRPSKRYPDQNRRLCLLTQYSEYDVDTVRTFFELDKPQWRGMDFENSHAATELLFAHLDPQLARFVRSSLYESVTDPTPPFPVVFMRLASINSDMSIDHMIKLSDQWHKVRLTSFAGQDITAYHEKLRNMYHHHHAGVGYCDNLGYHYLKEISVCPSFDLRKLANKLLPKYERALPCLRDLDFFDRDKFMRSKGLHIIQLMDRVQSLYHDVCSADKWPPLVNTGGATDTNIGSGSKTAWNVPLQQTGSVMTLQSNGLQ